MPWRDNHGRIEVLLIHRPRYDDWSFPKGKLDPGETIEQCAVREMREETGLGGELGESLPTALYEDHKGRPKEVSYWLMQVLEIDSEPVANEEADQFQWLEPLLAARVLTYEIDQALLTEAELVLKSVDQQSLDIVSGPRP